ncbi:hypothetical protein EMGBS10_18640 [Opitutia bacterium]|nr:hypothetical protein EMGBS10_18640 [Opitutae bacterium]
MGQRLCGLSLVDARTLGAPRTGKVWQWAATKQLLWMWDLKAGLLGSSLFYLTILTISAADRCMTIGPTCTSSPARPPEA